MVLAEQKLSLREWLHKVVDALPDDEIAELTTFVDYIQYKHKVRQGSPWAKEFYDLFAPVREDARASGMTGDEIDQLLDEELAEVRRERNP